MSLLLNCIYIFRMPFFPYVYITHSDFNLSEPKQSRSQEWCKRCGSPFPSHLPKLLLNFNTLVFQLLHVFCPLWCFTISTVWAHISKQLQNVINVTLLMCPLGVLQCQSALYWWHSEKTGNTVWKYTEFVLLIIQIYITLR